MKTWQPLSTAFTAPNDFIVEPVGSEEALIELGRHLHNGLMVHHAAWAGQCQRGRRQIFRVFDPTGEIVANGELEVKNGVVKTMFVRGQGNREFAPGDHEYDAVAAYLEAVNGRKVELLAEIGRDGFAARASEALTPWQQAVKAAKAKVISPFLALITGSAVIEQDGKPTISPEADDVEEVTWTPLSNAFHADNGHVVEPVRSRTGLRTLGEELENGLAIMHGHYADFCSRGITQFAAIYTDADGIVAMAELRAVRGRVTVVSCRGRFDEAAPDTARKAADQYAAAVNNHVLVPDVTVGSGRFFPRDAAVVEQAELEYGDEGVPTLAPGVRASSVYSETDDELYAVDEEFADDGLPPEPADQPLVNPAAWTPLTDRFVAENGMVVEPVADEEMLRQLGVAFNNALSSYHRLYADRCQRGEIQIVRILDASGALVSNAEVRCYGNQVAPAFNRGMDNAPASEGANLALDSWCEAVNECRIELKGAVTENGFAFEARQNGMGM